MPSRIPDPPPETSLQAPLPATAIAPRLDNPVRGIVLTVVATLILSCSDLFSKRLVDTLPPIEVAWLRYAAFVIFVLAGAAWKGPPRILATRRIGFQVLRGLGLVGSTIIFTTGLRYLPIADAIATSFVWPIFVMALSVAFLGEKVGIRRWSAAAIGLVGVLIVMRPGTSAFQLASLLPILSALVWSISLIVTRWMSGVEDPLTTLTFSGLIGFIVLTLLLPFGWREPSLVELGLGILNGAMAALGHFLVILACRFCNASVLAPLFYAQLIWTTGLGIVFLNAFPDRWTVIGGAVILTSGLYMAHRERLRARARLVEDVAKLPSP